MGAESYNKQEWRTLKMEDVTEHYEVFIIKFKKEPTVKEFIEWVRDRENFLKIILNDYGDKYKITSITE